MSISGPPEIDDEASACPGPAVWACVTGDGGFAMLVQDLCKTLARPLSVPAADSL